MGWFVVYEKCEKRLKLQHFKYQINQLLVNKKARIAYSGFQVILDLFAIFLLP
jgi:hypothetical protein